MECLSLDFCGESSVEITPSGMYERTMLAERLRFTALPDTDKRHENGFFYGELRGGPRISDRLLRCDPDRVEGVWNAPKETEVPT